MGKLRLGGLSLLALLLAAPAPGASAPDPHGPDSARILSHEELDQNLPEKARLHFGIRFPIHRGYQWNDKGGRQWLLLTERIREMKDSLPLHDSIQAFCVAEKNGRPALQWTMNDFISPPGPKGQGETSIWFWTRYFSLTDLDGDGLFDPVIVYGTSALNDLDDGRIKILVWHKGRKHALRHQNGVLDFDRNTRIDASFYRLPKPVQARVRILMERMEAEEKAIFPAGWQKAMAERKTLLRE